MGDAPFDPLGAIRFRHPPQEAGIKPRIKLIGIVHPVVGQMRKAASLRRLQLQAIVAIGRIMPLGLPVHPEMLKSRRPMILAGPAETVEIAFAWHTPIFEIDAQLERRLGRAHEVGFVDAQYAIIGNQRRDGAFTHPYRPDLLAFDQGDLRHWSQRAGECGGRHPTGRAATGDDDATRRG